MPDDADRLLRASLLGDVNIAQFTPPLHFNPKELTELIIQHGTDSEYRRAMICPCSRIETGMAAIGCKACRGLGFLYPPELRCPTTFLNSGRSNDLRQQPAGYTTSGQMQVTFPSGLIPGRGDLVLPACEEHEVHEHFHRAVQQVDHRELPRQFDVAPRPLRARAERLLYPEITKLEEVYWLQDRERPMRGREGVDFTLQTRNGGLHVVWTDGRGPAPGEGYSLRYRAPATYMVEPGRALHRNEANVTLPYRATLHRLDQMAEADLARRPA
jgi:hypothetical protein